MQTPLADFKDLSVGSAISFCPGNSAASCNKVKLGVVISNDELDIISVQLIDVIDDIDDKERGINKPRKVVLTDRETRLNSREHKVAWALILSASYWDKFSIEY
jgi:hypothetical protein